MPSYSLGVGTDNYMRDDQVKAENDQVKGGNNNADKKKSPVALESVSKNEDLQVCHLHICMVAVLTVC